MEFLWRILLACLAGRGPSGIHYKYDFGVGSAILDSVRDGTLGRVGFRL